MSTSTDIVDDILSLGVALGLEATVCGERPATGGQFGRRMLVTPRILRSAPVPCRVCRAPHNHRRRRSCRCGERDLAVPVRRRRVTSGLENRIEVRSERGQCLRWFRLEGVSWLNAFHETWIYPAAPLLDLRSTIEGKKMKPFQASALPTELSDRLPQNAPEGASNGSGPDGT